MYSDPIKGSSKQKDHFTSGNGRLKHPAWCQPTIFVYCDSFPIFFVIDIDIDMTDTRSDRMPWWTHWLTGLPGAGVDGAVVPVDQVGGAGHPHRAGAQLSLWEIRLFVKYIY